MSSLFQDKNFGPEVITKEKIDEFRKSAALLLNRDQLDLKENSSNDEGNIRRN